MKEERELNNESAQIDDNLRLEEVLRGYRVIDIPPKHPLRQRLGIEKLRIYDRTIMAISRMGDHAYAIERDRLLSEGGLYTESEMLGILKKRGVWDEDKEKMIETLRENITLKIEDREVLLTNRMNAKEGTAKYKKIDEEISQMNDDIEGFYSDLGELISLKTRFFRDTVEMQAQIKQRIGWLSGAICRDEGDDVYDPGKRIWKTLEELDSSHYMRHTDLTWLLAEAETFWNVAEQESESFFDESPVDQTSD